MSLAAIEAEIRRFLSDSAPEVLCIKGKWGVGKTYGWRGYLREARKAGRLPMTRYSYVSLFGLNSLDDLRYAVFENTVSGTNIGEDPNATTFEELLKDVRTPRKLKPIAKFLAAFVNRQGLIDLLAKSAFLTVRNQLICLDDLERAGTGLGPREVLGLASLLKEERKCKVALLLNDEQHDQKQEFERQLEKVADNVLRFNPTPEEAVKIALIDHSSISDLIRSRLVDLDITNIRLIKKIERLANRLVELLPTNDPAIIGDSVATLVLAIWVIHRPEAFPTLNFLRTYNADELIIRSARAPLEPEIEHFRSLVSNYPFRSVNKLDLLIINGAEAGYFLAPPLIEVANELIEQHKDNPRDSEFSRVWNELYHGSLATDDDDFLDALYESAKKDAAAITPLNINSAIRILREAGRAGQADEVVHAYVAAHDGERPEFFDISTHHFLADDPPDGRLREAFAAHRAAYVDPRDPLDVLREIGRRRNWDDADVMLMAKQNVDDFERMFEALRGDEVRSSIQMIRTLGHSRRPESDAIERASAESLRRIAAKSPLRAQKIRALGVEL